MDKIVFHGSPIKGLFEIIPRISTHGKKYVYATEDKLFAALFTQKWNDFLLNVGYDYEGRLEIVERCKNSLIDIYKDSYTYDSMNRRLTTISPEGNILQIVRYDKNDNIEKMMDGLRYNGDANSSKGTVYTYDALGRVITEADPLGNQSTYVYNVLGCLIKQTDKRGNTTCYEFEIKRC